MTDRDEDAARDLVQRAYQADQNRLRFDTAAGLADILSRVNQSATPGLSGVGSEARAHEPLAAKDSIQDSSHQPRCTGTVSGQTQHEANSEAAPWRSTAFQEPRVAVEGTSSPTWLRSADIVIGQHGSRRAARRWLASVDELYPSCLLAVARQRNGRWCLVGLPARRLLVRGGRFDLATAEQLGRVIYYLWIAQHAGSELVTTGPFQCFLQ